jgi:hypothetical protein
MKRKVVKQVDSEALVAIDDTNDDGKIYAFWSSNDNYSVIVKSNETGYYTDWLFTDRMQEEIYGPYSTLHTLLRALLAGGYEVYEFDDEIDFTIWIRDMYSSL